MAESRVRQILDIRRSHNAVRHRSRGRPDDDIQDHLHVPVPIFYTYVPGNVTQKELN